MRGVILGSDTIRGEDGKCYSYELKDIQNLNGKTNLERCEVDFEVDDSKKSLSAKAIFITKSPSSNFGNIFKDSSIPSIKMKAYISLGCGLFSLIPIIGLLFGIVSIVFLILAILNVSKISGSKELLKNCILYTAIAIIGKGVIAIGGTVVFMVIGLLVVALGLFFAYKYYLELADLTQEKFFFYVLILHVVASITLPILVVSVIVGIAATVVEIIAWVRFKDIKNASNDSPCLLNELNTLFQKIKNLRF